MAFLWPGPQAAALLMLRARAAVKRSPAGGVGAGVARIERVLCRADDRAARSRPLPGLLLGPLLATAAAAARRRRRAVAGAGAAGGVREPPGLARAAAAIACRAATRTLVARARQHRRSGRHVALRRARGRARHRRRRAPRRRGPGRVSLARRALRSGCDAARRLDRS